MITNVFKKSNGSNEYYLDVDGEIYELSDFLNELKGENLEGDEQKDLSLKNKKFKIRKKDNFYEIFYSPNLFDFFEPINLKINEQIKIQVYSTFQFYEIKEDYLQEGFELYLNDGKNNIKVEEKALRNHGGSTIFVQFKYLNSKIDKIFERKESDKVTLKQLSLNYPEFFSKESLDENVINTEKRNVFEKELYDFCNSFSNQNYKFYCGKTGIGKTVTLLNYRYKYRNVFYINMRIIFKYCKTIEKFYEFLKNELAFTFNSYNEYDKFINDLNIFKYEESTLLLGYSFIYEKLKFIIEKLVIYYKRNTVPLFIMLDQYKPKYEYSSQIFELLKTESGNHMNIKILICSSINEEEIKDNIYNSIYLLNKEEDSYNSIDKLIDDYASENLSENKSRFFELFGKLPKYLTRIKNCEENKLEDLKSKLKAEVLMDVEHSLNKLHLKDNNKLECIFQIIVNEGEIISKEKLNKIYKFIPLKYISIVPQNKNKDNIFKYNNDNTNYIIKYSFPILKEVFNKLLKMKKKVENRNSLLFTEGSEEGLILEKLIYLSLDKNEICFGDEIKIEDSIEVDQIFECSKLYVDPYDFEKYKAKENVIELNDDDIFKKLFQSGKNYHICQHKKTGKIFDGGLLIAKKKNSFDFLIYQVTKKKDPRKRLTNSDICEYKDMIKNNIEILFDIKIDNVSFVYIMEYENQDLGLIEHCESFDNQLDYFFYSYEYDKFVNKRGKEIKINQFLKDIKPLKNIIKCMPKNKGRDLETIKNIINSMPSDFDIDKKSLIGRKKKREEVNKKCGNFMELYSKNEKKIFTLSSKGKKDYDNNLKNNKLAFFSEYNYILDKSKNKKKEIKTNDKNDKGQKEGSKDIKNENINTDKKENAEQTNETSGDIKDKKMNDEKDSKVIGTIMDNYLKDIVDFNKESNRYNFNQKYDEMLRDFFKINTNEKKYPSIFGCITKIYILANILEFPFYYLIINTNDIDDKLLIFKRKEVFEVYDFKKKKNKTYEEFKILFISLIQNEFYENHYVIACSFDIDK